MSFPVDECINVINELLKYSISAMFANPVDPERDRCPNYLQLIKEPMDLGTVKKRLESGYYKTVSDWRHDMDLIWNNSYTFNKVNSFIGLITKDLQEKYNQISEYINDGLEITWREKLYSLSRELNELLKESPKIAIPKKKKGRRRDDMSNSFSIDLNENPINNYPMTHDEIVKLADDIKKIQSNSQKITIMNMLKKLEPSIVLDPDHIDIDLCCLQMSTLHQIRSKLDDFMENM
ncbi:Bromodomain containing protein [Trichomonas vaginalis G3]|uniref:Bromodomain containing protein n=1 Tax=Trichomonas vaginalis (strain ATCC PRA-98 / G3) TaxID=412133 RepID=A2DRA3_TRIV3|nr:acetylation-dependent protein binding [Trichomonas vaginalis G3]EAY17029.1 Bromodomain containing protein [Trichomonas vaginalis G3]KAI5517892.1 acetylation-dependent protein binding [Trichomonas vaginalis G3]|eukprot:XP_001329252.1 Bromodomain containing protein [Trichomonas vaginalis G3]